MSLIQLQGIGLVKAKEAGEFKIGDVMVWNYGATSVIKGIAKETKAFITYITESKGETYERKLKKSRLVGFE